MLGKRLEKVRERIEQAAERAARPASEIHLIAVTKKFPASLIREAYELGLRDFGENYVQEFEQKRSDLQGLNGARFHLIGHLQSNKARKAAALFDGVQTVDSPKLASKLNEGRAELGPDALEAMVEVKLSPEEAKAGVGEKALAETIGAFPGLEHLRLTGLMTMPPWSDDPERSRPYFRKLKELARQYGLKNLSMGMSHDLEVAIEEGATHIRVGTALFGPRPKA